MNTKICKGCGEPFEPELDYYYFCASCYQYVTTKTCQQTNLNGTPCQRHVTSRGDWRYCTQHWNDLRAQARVRRIEKREAMEQKLVVLDVKNWLKELVEKQ